MTNTLAYCEHSQITEVKRLVTLGPGKLFQPSLMLESKALAELREASFRCPTLAWPSTDEVNIV